VRIQKTTLVEQNAEEGPDGVICACIGY